MFDLNTNHNSRDTTGIENRDTNAGNDSSNRTRSHTDFLTSLSLDLMMSRIDQIISGRVKSAIRLIECGQADDVIITQGMDCVLFFLFFLTIIPRKLKRLADCIVPLSSKDPMEIFKHSCIFHVHNIEQRTRLADVFYHCWHRYIFFFFPTRITRVQLTPPSQRVCFITVHDFVTHDFGLSFLSLPCIRLFTSLFFNLIILTKKNNNNKKINKLFKL